MLTCTPIRAERDLHLAALPNPKGQMPWPRSLHATVWHNIRAEIRSSTAETDWATWSVIRAEPQNPLSAHAWAGGSNQADIVKASTGQSHR